MLRPALVAVVCALLLGACTGGDDPERPTPTQSATPAADDPCVGQSWQTTDVGDRERRHLVVAPTSWDGSERLPVVYFFHGLGGQADTTLAYTAMAERVDELGYIVVAPQAVGEGSSWDYRSPVDQEGSDLAYVRELMDTMAQQDCVDPDRQYAAGLSNGSILAFAMACSGEFPVQAYGGVGAIFYDAQCDASPPTSVVYFHGTADPVVPFEGGDTPIEPVGPAREAIDGWAEHAGCGAPPAPERIGSDVELFDWQGCGEDPVDAYVIEGGGHTWPGAVPVPTLGETTSTVRANEIMIDFFGLDD